MKKLLKKLPVALFCCLIVFLLFAFSQITFDIRAWGEQTRSACALVEGIAIFLVIAMLEDV